MGVVQKKKKHPRRMGEDNKGFQICSTRHKGIKGERREKTETSTTNNR